ncbi:hypothetical protein E8E14_000714 [Neopestalotiopsis sp. 37M]|nr:hypothetical protein E8E14_000714 [Neopestalotiopsis sp. 37M]
MSFMLFNDNLCGHPFSNSFVAPSLNQCWRTTWGGRSLYIANLPACENGGTPMLWVAAPGGCWTNWQGKGGGEEGAQGQQGGEPAKGDDGWKEGEAPEPGAVAVPNSNNNDNNNYHNNNKRQNMPGMCLSSAQQDANSMYWYSFSDTAVCHTLPCQQAIQYTKFVCSGAANVVPTSDSSPPAIFAMKTPIVMLFVLQVVLVVLTVIHNALG